MQRRDLTRLVRILSLMGSDQAGERASAALAAHKLVTSRGLDWAGLLDPPPKEVVRTVVRHVRDYDVDEQAAADARMRQLKATNDRLEKEVRSLRRRVAGLLEQQRQRAFEESDTED